jgi:hypothetical protein
MKRVMNFFSRPDEQLQAARTIYVSKEPALATESPSKQQSRPTSTRQFTPQEKSSAATKAEPIPTDYADIVQFFQKKVRDRKSPYHGLVNAADCLKEFIPDETSRLKVVLAVCGDKWPCDTLSLAISTHISDIEHARSKAREDLHLQSSERAASLRQQARDLKAQNQKIEDEISVLNESIQKLRATLHSNDSILARLNQQIQLAEMSANAVSFVDQAAENLKNDLLAKKVILGLP